VERRESDAVVATPLRALDANAGYSGRGPWRLRDRRAKRIRQNPVCKRHAHFARPSCTTRHSVSPLAFFSQRTSLPSLWWRSKPPEEVGLDRQDRPSARRSTQRSPSRSESNEAGRGGSWPRAWSSSPPRRARDDRTLTARPGLPSTSLVARRSKRVFSPLHSLVHTAQFLALFPFLEAIEIHDTRVFIIG
jgi:hypothetical protein